MVKLRRKKINENFDNMYAISSAETAGYNPYSYSIISLNNPLEQKGNDNNYEHYINVGSYISGEGYYNNDIYSGKIRNIVKNEDGSISHIIILCDKSAKFIKIKINNKLKLLK